MNSPTLSHYKDRNFNWVSSKTCDPNILEKLAIRMNRFYESEGGDKLYRAMFLELESTKPARESIRYLLPRYICDINPSECLEIGCGSGRVYRQLREYGLNGNYCGLEPSIGAIKVCREKHPESVWINGTVYDIPCNDNQFDCVFALYVLEHVVFPERALREMIRVVRPGGRLLLVFPDFVETGRLGSQFIGLSPGRVKEKIQSGRILDAFFTAYDSRIRLPQALRTVVRKHGHLTLMPCTSHQKKRSWNGQKRRDFPLDFRLVTPEIVSRPHLLRSTKAKGTKSYDKSNCKPHSSVPGPFYTVNAMRNYGPESDELHNSISPW